MNQLIKNMVNNLKPKLQWDEKEKKLYEASLLLLASTVCQEFIDIPKLPKDRFSRDGLFYTIPFYDDETMYSSGGLQRLVLVVWRVINKSSYCPLRIDVKIVDANNFYIIIYDQGGEKTEKRELLIRENGTYYSQVKDYNKITLSQLVKT